MGDVGKEGERERRREGGRGEDVRAGCRDEAKRERKDENDG